MRKTVLITGASAGIGRAAARLFQQKGWNVAATMRSPDAETELAALPNVICPALDVNDEASIAAALAQTLARFGRIDALVNNAGYGLVGAFESFSAEQIQRQFDTNVFGLMRVSRAVLPHFRAQKSGHLINVASMGGRTTFPLYSVYHATKWAVDGFSESLAWELAQFGVRVKIIEPGAIKTDFYGRSTDRTVGSGVEDYESYTRRLLAAMDRTGQAGARPETVAEAIFKAANDHSGRLRYTVGLDAKAMLMLRHVMPDSWYQGMVRLALKA